MGLGTGLFRGTDIYPTSTLCSKSVVFARVPVRGSSTMLYDTDAYFTSFRSCNTSNYCRQNKPGTLTQALISVE
jgi:hypothetical protein